MAEASTTAPRPLCVDLDGTLVKTDTFAQALLLLIRTRPAALFSIPGWAAGGLAAFKRRIAQEIQLDPAALPYHSELLAFLKSEKAKGRELLLVTASDAIPAQAIAAHLGLFSDVMASDGVINLKAARKRDTLIARFGAKGFDYAGNATDDLAVWEAAAGIIAVNPCAPVRRALKNRSAQIFENRPAKMKSWLKALRVQQWSKNILVFLPMLLAHELTTPSLYVKAVQAFFAFSFAASAIYVINDLMDLHADQHHPRKQRRPFAAGNLSLLAAAAAVLILSRAAEGDEEIRHMLVGNVLLVDLPEIMYMGVLYGLVGLFHWFFRKKFILLSTNPEKAYQGKMSVKWWDMLFYLTFGLVVTSSVHIAGVLLVFTFLIVPAVGAILFSDKLSHRLWLGWIYGFIASCVGIGLSYCYDLPTGATVVCVFGGFLILLALTKTLLPRIVK